MSTASPKLPIFARESLCDEDRLPFVFPPIRTDCDLDNGYSRPVAARIAQSGQSIIQFGQRRRIDPKSCMRLQLVRFGQRFGDPDE